MEQQQYKTLRTGFVCHFILFALFKEPHYLNFKPEGIRAEEWAAELLSAVAFCSAQHLDANNSPLKAPATDLQFLALNPVLKILKYKAQLGQTFSN